MAIVISGGFADIVPVAPDDRPTSRCDAATRRKKRRKGVSFPA
ncbi:MAG: hypothetical protein P9E24_03110 [Candidatus Competibacter sp.]|nr:hypothetical protein [Candidatus Competibacter sp.]MDG4582935.1 hypothetical protein [Candidatus Competibacter sp.]